MWPFKKKKDNVSWEYYEGTSITITLSYNESKGAVIEIHKSNEYIPKYKIILKGVTEAELIKHKPEIYVNFKNRLKHLNDYDS